MTQKGWQFIDPPTDQDPLLAAALDSVRAARGDRLLRTAQQEQSEALWFAGSRNGRAWVRDQAGRVLPANAIITNGAIARGAPVVGQRDGGFLYINQMSRVLPAPQPVVAVQPSLFFWENFGGALEVTPDLVQFNSIPPFEVDLSQQGYTLPAQIEYGESCYVFEILQPYWDNTEMIEGYPRYLANYEGCAIFVYEFSELGVDENGGTFPIYEPIYEGAEFRYQVPYPGFPEEIPPGEPSYLHYAGANLARIMPQASGQIIFEGTFSQSSSPAELRLLIFQISQSSPLFSATDFETLRAALIPAYFAAFPNPGIEANLADPLAQFDVLNLILEMAWNPDSASFFNSIGLTSARRFYTDLQNLSAGNYSFELAAPSTPDLASALQISQNNNPISYPHKSVKYGFGQNPVEQGAINTLPSGSYLAIASLRSFEPFSQGTSSFEFSANLSINIQ